jgi:hypothetical protein
MLPSGLITGKASLYSSAFATRRLLTKKAAPVEAARLRVGSFLVAAVWVWLAAAVAPAPVQHPPLVEGVDAIAITVSDMECAVDFYSRVLTIEKVSDVEVTGESYEHLEGVFGLRMRVVRMKLGDESIELIEYLTPRGRLAPTDSRSNDLWFQHIAIIVSDIDTA